MGESIAVIEAAIARKRDKKKEARKRKAEKNATRGDQRLKRLAFDGRGTDYE